MKQTNQKRTAGTVSSKIIGGAHPRAPSPRRWGKQKGRSMIEMLAVLAIIGVLSITALIGFTYAMNKHRANETIYDVMLRGTNVPMVDENYANKPSGHQFVFRDLPSGTYYPMTTKKDAGSSYYVEATGVTYRVCELILKMNPTDIDQIVVNNSVYTGDSDICGNTDGLAMKFCFGSDGTICDGTGHGGSSGGSSGGTSGGDSGSGGTSGGGFGSGEVGTTCDPACGACEQCIDGTCVSTCDTCEECVDGSCVVQSCPITCSDTQQPTGTNECGCPTGCEDKCPNLSCGTCELINYETCSCDVDSSCTCEDRGGETIYYLTGTCCEIPSTCCSLNDTCVQEDCTITDSTQCGILCEEGAQTTSVCCTAVSIDGDAPENHVWVGDPYGEGYCCASKSESQACCEADSGKWCDGTCCVNPFTCVNGTCCHPDNQCDTTCCSDGETCVNGSCCSTPNADATECCAYGVGTNGACCTIDPATCTNGTTTDDNGCTVCVTGCTGDKPVSCQSGSDTWCCAEGNTCGTTVGQCCLGGTCCEGTAYCDIIEDGVCAPGTYSCCPSGNVVLWDPDSSRDDNGIAYGISLCCPKGDTFITVDAYYYQKYTSGTEYIWEYTEDCGDYYYGCSSDLPCNGKAYYVSNLGSNRCNDYSLSEGYSCTPY